MWVGPGWLDYEAPQSPAFVPRALRIEEEAPHKESFAFPPALAVSQPWGPQTHRLELLLLIHLRIKGGSEQTLDTAFPTERTGAL